jgi:hypothetical protein
LAVSDQDWVIALEEMSLFWPASHIRQDDYFLELRDILRSAGLNTILQQTCRNLAHTCYDRAGAETGEASAAFLQAAVALMAEAWLSAEDTEDLVVFCPHCDFSHFARTGDGLRIYRRLAADGQAPLAAPGPRWALADLNRAGLPPAYSQFALSLLRLPALAGLRWLDLGPILWKAGQARTLARTLWLLANDGLSLAPAGQAALGLTPDVLVDMTSRAMVLYGLHDPWQWRQGRSTLYLSGCYQTLQQVLDTYAGSVGGVAADYLQSLRLWYGCYDADEPGLDRNLQEMTRQLKNFLRESQDYLDQSTSLLAIGRVEARKLVEIEEAARLLLASTAPSRLLESQSDLETVLPPTGVPKVLRAASGWTAPSARLSQFFFQAWQTLLALRDERYLSQKRFERDVDALLRQLRKLAAELKQHRDLIFALPHEAVVLRFAYQQEIKYIERLAGGLENSAILEMTLHNRWLDLQAEPDLRFEVTNIGHAPARDVEIVLAPGDFELLEGSPLREIPYLAQSAVETITYPVRPLQPEITLTLSYTYRDRHDQKQAGSRQFRPEVRSLEPLPFKVKVNRYQFGRPIQEPNDFFGRRWELFDILSLLKAGGRQNVLLRGPRRMGKTSLLYMLQRALQDPGTRRLFDVPPEWDADLDQVHPVFVTFQSVPIQSDLAHIYQFFRGLLEQTCQSLSMEPADAQAILDRYVARWPQVGAAEATREQLQAILDRRPGQRIAILLDEYDEVYRPQGRDLDTALRVVVSAEQRLTWVIASTLGLYKESKSVGSPWFNIFLIVELERLTRSAAEELVSAPSREEQVFWRSDAVLSLLQETGRHPAFIQLFCSRLITWLNRERTNYILNETIAAIASQIVAEQETAHSHFEFYWSDTGGVGKLILLLVDESPAPLKRTEIRRRVHARLAAAFGQRPDQRVVDPAGSLVEWRDVQFKDGMEWVEKITNAISPDEQRRYRFTIPLFHRWLRRHRRREDLEKEALDAIAAEMERDFV